MQFIAEHGSCRTFLLLIFFVNRRPGKTKEHGQGECFPDNQQHVSKCGAMAFIHNKNNALGSHFFQVRGIQAIFTLIPDIAHFLEGRDNQGVGRIIAFQLAGKNTGIFRCLHSFILFSKAPIFP